jgi:hypothetical protein
MGRAIAVTWKYWRWPKRMFQLSATKKLVGLHVLAILDECRIYKLHCWIRSEPHQMTRVPFVPEVVTSLGPRFAKWVIQTCIYKFSMIMFQTWQWHGRWDGKAKVSIYTARSVRPYFVPTSALGKYGQAILWPSWMRKFLTYKGHLTIPVHSKHSHPLAKEVNINLWCGRVECKHAVLVLSGRKCTLTNFY